MMTELNFDSGTVWTGDNLAVMSGINNDCIDLIYLDPPFNSKVNYEAPIGRPAEGAKFDDIWKLSDINEYELELIKKDNKSVFQIITASEFTHSGSMKSYLIFMASRLLEMQRILKPTGCLYLHCDPTASHYLKLLMDGIFGKNKFCNEIIWGYRTQGVSKTHWPRNHDVIFMYSNGENFTYNPLMEKQVYDKPFRHTKMDIDGSYFVETYMRDVWDLDETKPLTGQGKERIGYPTQKPLKLLERIIYASSYPGDMVFDPFCGCATTMVAAEKLKRQWAGIDISPKAVELVKNRLSQHSTNQEHESESQLQTEEGKKLITDVINPDSFPVRTDNKVLPDPKTYKRELYGRQEGKCAGCKESFNVVDLTVDYIQPASQGGQDNINNIQLLCGHCNSVKGNRDMAFLMSKLDNV